jgi:5-methyltetrahydrofolate--homocysteine methyltransferase
VSIAERLHEILARRILVLDGAIGTQLPDDANRDALVLSAPDTVSRVHEAYLEAGADIISTNTFRSTSLAQEASGLASRVHDLNATAARLARTAADAWTRRVPDRPRFVAGVMGPVRGAPAALRAAYREQVGALLAGRVDLILVETIVDSAQAAAAIAAIHDEYSARGVELPMMVSATVDRRGRTPDGQTLEAFCASMRHARAFSIGLNCGLGARAIGPFLAELSGLADGYVSCHPNAGLPDAFGMYEEGPRDTAAVVRELAASGLVNIAGGCCGTTPAHIQAIAVALRDVSPRIGRRNRGAL